MAKSRSKMTRSKGRQVHPEGKVVTITPERREAIKKRRLELGWTQGDLAKRAGVTPATISNIESGRTDQPRRVVYSAVMRALKLGDQTPQPATDEAYRRIVDGASDLDEGLLEAVADFIDKLRKPK